MEVQFTPEVQAKLDEMARDTGWPSNELAATWSPTFSVTSRLPRETIDRRCGDLESGRVWTCLWSMPSSPGLRSLPLRFTTAGNYLVAYAPDRTPTRSSRSCMAGEALSYSPPSPGEEINRYCPTAGATAR